MSKGTFLYVGGFVLPDKNAAAQRVVGIAKILKELGYTVVFLNRNPEEKEITNWIERDYFGFKCYETGIENKKRDLWNYLYKIEYIKRFIDDDIIGIIAYNYPAIALYRLNKYCKNNGILCLGDVTEWYGVKGKSLPYKIIKSLDTCLRMRIINKRLNGLIVISDYLENYYKKILPIANIPPTVDKNDHKWEHKEEEHDGTWFVYAGSPSGEKERLDIIYDTIKKLAKQHNVKLTIIGITKEQFRDMYNINNGYLGKDTFAEFLGRIPHEDVIKIVTASDYSIIIRDQNRVNTAGFPTKVVESISCKTAVLANKSSCIDNYIHDGINGIILSELNPYNDIKQLLEEKRNIKVISDTFDYRKFTSILASSIKECFKENQKR